MPSATIPDHDSLFRRTLEECRELYVSSAALCAREFPQLLPLGKGKQTLSAEQFVALMDDLHRALVLKVYFSVAEADRKWSSRERFLAEELFDHLWGKRLTGEGLRTAARRLAEDATKLKWYSLVRPFDQIVPLRERVGTLETLVMRLANLVARCDGILHPKEAAAVKFIQEELHRHLRPIPIDEPNEHDATNAIGTQAIETLEQEADGIYAASHPRDGGGRKGEGGRKKRSDPPPSALPLPPPAP